MALVRILFINRSYWPDTEATGQLLTELCESLSDSFEVHVLAGAPNASLGDEEWQAVTCRNGVTIHRVKHTQFTKGSMLLKAVNLWLSNVSFFDYQPQEELAHTLIAADLHLIPLTAILGTCLMPSKLYGVLAAGRPYLTNAVPESDLYKITHQQLVGLTVPPNDESAIAKAILDLKSDPQRQKLMRANARNTAMTVFTKDKSIGQFKGLLERLS